MSDGKPTLAVNPVPVLLAMILLLVVFFVLLYLWLLPPRILVQTVTASGDPVFKPIHGTYERPVAEIGRRRWVFDAANDKPDKSATADPAVQLQFRQVADTNAGDSRGPSSTTIRYQDLKLKTDYQRLMAETAFVLSVTSFLMLVVWLLTRLFEKRETAPTPAATPAAPPVRRSTCAVLASEHRHLARCADFRVRVAERVDTDRVAVRGTHALAPRRELGARPLEAVVGVAELARRQVLEPHVVLAVRRRQDHHAGLRAAEQHTLEGTKARLVEVLDHLHNRGCVEAFDAGVAVGERAVEQFHATAQVVR